MSKAPAQWERVARVVALRDTLAKEVKIIGNGDILSLDDARDKVRATGADGAMIGRALFGNPWFFHPTKRLPIRLHTLPTSGVDRETLVCHDTDDLSAMYVTLEERLLVLVEHSKLFVSLLPHKNFSVMKKHYKAYVNAFPGAADLRNELMQTNTPAEVETVVHSFLKQYKKNALD